MATPPVKKAKPVLGRFVTSEYQPNALHSHVYSELRRALLDGIFSPGETLSLRSIAGALGTSPMPVREAVGRLVAEGALEITGSRAIAVPLLTREQFTELSELRIELEGGMAERAVRHGGSSLATALEEIEMRSVLARKRSLRERLAMNRQFHFTIYRAAGCDLRLRMIELLWLQSAAFTHVSLAKDDIAHAGHHHRGVIAAVRANDPAGARAAIESDVSETYQHLLAITTFPASKPRLAGRLDDPRADDASLLSSPGGRVDDPFGAGRPS